MKRSICIHCKTKRYQSKMVQFGQHWLCLSCIQLRNSSADHSTGDLRRIKVLNLYAGIGGNRWLWPGSLDVTAVEHNPKVAAEYMKNFPLDHVIIGDAHYYLLKHYREFDIIWSSPPCQSHSKMNYVIPKKRFPDLSLYQEILFLRSFYNGKFVVENVRPYYTPLVKEDHILCRHLFWTNVSKLTPVTLPEFPPEYRGALKGINVMPRKVICDWLGIRPGENTIYLSGKSSTQVYRNCVHPVLGLSIMNDILESMKGQ